MRSSPSFRARRSLSPSVNEPPPSTFIVGHKHAHWVLGGIATIAGSVAGCGALVGLLHGAERVLAAPGLLLGAVCTLPCLLGWRAAATNSKALIMSCLVWSILAAVFAFLGLITFSVDRVDPPPSASASNDQKFMASIRWVAAKAGQSACAIEIFVASVHAGVAFVSYGQLCVPRPGVHSSDAAARLSAGHDSYPGQRQALISSDEKQISPVLPLRGNRQNKKGVGTQTLPQLPALIGTTPRLKTPTPPPRLPPVPKSPPHSVTAIAETTPKIPPAPPAPLPVPPTPPRGPPVAPPTPPRVPPAPPAPHMGPRPPPQRPAPPPYEQAVNLLSRRERWAKQMR